MEGRVAGKSMRKRHVLERLQKSKAQKRVEEEEDERSYVGFKMGDVASCGNIFLTVAHSRSTCKFGEGSKLLKYS